MTRSAGPGRKLVLAIGAVVVLTGAWVLRGPSAVRADLEKDGHTDVEVRWNGPLDFSFTSKQKDGDCSGSVTRLPFSMSRSLSCAWHPPAPPPSPPVHSNREILTEAMTRLFKSLNLTAIHCPEIADQAEIATCSIEADAGVPLEIKFNHKNGEWTVLSPTQIGQRSELAASLGKQLSERSKKPATFTVDCGAGLFGGVAGGVMSCTVTRKGLKKPGTIDITFKEGTAYEWSATGI